MRNDPGFTEFVGDHTRFKTMTTTNSTTGCCANVFFQNVQVCQSDIFAWRITHFQTDLPEASGSTELVAFDHISILAMAGSEKYFSKDTPYRL